MKNHEKSTQDCFGTPENHPGWEGLAGLARSVALEKENKGQKGVAALIELATTVRAQATGKGRVRVLTSVKRLWVQSSASTRPEASGLGGFTKN